MSADAIQLNGDGDSYCRIVDPASGPIHVPIHEISAQGALLDSRLQYQVNDYIDVTLCLKGLQPRPLFAHVVSCDKAGIRLRWLHFDPGDDAKLSSLLQSFQNHEVEVVEPASAAPAVGAKPLEPAARKELPGTGSEHGASGSRRVIRPNTVITPFAEPAASPKAKSPTQSDRMGTRRVVRPSGPQKAEAGAKDEKSSPAESSGSRENIRIATESFEKNDKSEPGSGSGAKKIGIIGQDGKLDIGATIRSKAKTVRASELAARHDRVKVLNMASIKNLIQEAVAEAVTHLTGSIGETERKRLLEEAESNFQERLKAFQAEKSGIEAHVKHLNDQLRMAQNLLEEERKRTISADQFTVSEKGLGEIEDKMRRVLERAIETGNVSPEMQEQLRGMIAHILDSERERIRTQEMEAQNAKIELLEKKIQRLAGTLEETERQRNEAQELAAALEAQGGGLRNIMTAGIKDSDAQKKRKLALMKEILDINRKMYEELGRPLNQYQEHQVVEAAAQAAATTTEAEGTVGALNRIAAAVKSALETPQEAAAKAKPAPAPAEPAVADPSAESVEEDAGESATIDPDDMPWEVQPIKVRDEDAEAHAGVKRITVPMTAPPPRERK